MGKRKIGEIYNRPIIEGDINLKTSSEIHKSELGVPQSGGSGGGETGGGDAPSGGGSSFEYFSVTDVEALSELVFLTSLIKLSYSGDVQILTSAIFEDVLNGNASLLAIGIDMALPLIMDGATVTPREFFESMGITDLSAFGWTPITKEQFYNPTI